MIRKKKKKKKRKEKANKGNEKFRGGEKEESIRFSDYYQGSRYAPGYLSLWTNFIIAAVAGENFHCA